MKSQLYLSLFFSAFLAAAKPPTQSEAVLAHQISAYPDALVSFIAIATAGNVLRVNLNWTLGRFSRNPAIEAGFLTLAILSLFLPGFCVNLYGCFFVLVTLAKGSRYIFVAALVTPIL